MIAPGYTDEALEILKAKKKGNYNVIEIDPNYGPAPIEHKEVFGITFEHHPLNVIVAKGLLESHLNREEMNL